MDNKTKKHFSLCARAGFDENMNKDEMKTEEKNVFIFLGKLFSNKYYIK
jgi:hypothetical protein